jgi:glycosyltransferase involved in cell wall biosynthesis
MVPYKRLDYVVRLFSANGRKLKVVGQGPEFGRLRRLAAKNIEFCGRVPEHELLSLYARSAALIMPGEEDFGMTMVESLASGKPVIALGRGGAMEIVTDGCGILYASPTEASLEEALRTFDRVASFIDPVHIQRRASEFSEAAFERGFRGALRRFGVAGVDRDGCGPRPQVASVASDFAGTLKPRRLAAIDFQERA